jgi:hypothetical protein
MQPSRPDGLAGRVAVVTGATRDPAVDRIVVEHRDRFCRFGTPYIDAALSAHGRELVVVDPAEVDDDLGARHDRVVDVDVRPPLRRAGGGEPGSPRPRVRRGGARQHCHTPWS